MKKIKNLFIIAFFVNVCNVYSQCGPFQIYEGFGTGLLPIQGGTWSQNSITYATTNARSDTAFKNALIPLLTEGL